MGGEVGRMIGAPPVVSDDVAWTRRADAAKAAARELADCRHRLMTIVDSNYFGRDCVEGLNLYNALRTSIVESGWRTQLAEHISELETLAATRLAAAESIHNADSQLTQDFEN
ncbi:hypothetical protein GCM10022238_03180 [Gordonia hankookensis]